MLFLLSGMSSFSFATSPDWAACNYAYNITYYDSPSNAGTINGYSNGQTQQIQHNRVPCQDYELYSSAQATPLSGYLFSSWSSSSSITLSSTSANPTDFSMGPGSGSITANYVPVPDLMNVLDFTYPFQSLGVSSVPNFPSNYASEPSCYSTANYSYGNATTTVCEYVVRPANVQVIKINSNDNVAISNFPAGAAKTFIMFLEYLNATQCCKIYATGADNFIPTPGSGWGAVNAGDVFNLTNSNTLFSNAISGLEGSLLTRSTYYYDHFHNDSTLYTLSRYYVDMHQGLYDMMQSLSGSSYPGTALGTLTVGAINALGCGAGVGAIALGVGALMTPPPLDFALGVAAVGFGGVALVYPCS